MAQQLVNVGAAPNDGTGDPLRTAYQKLNANDTELYGRPVLVSAGAVLPVGGGVGQILRKNSAADYDVAWQAFTDILHPLFVSGRYYSHVMRAGTPLTTVSHAADTINYTPVQIAAPVTIQSHTIKTGGSNAVAGNANIGLYSNVNGAPGALLQTIATAVAIPGTTATNLTITPAGGNFTLQPGVYWFAVQLDQTINMTGEATGAAANVFWMGTTNTSAGIFGITNAWVGYTEAKTYASGLPANATGVAAQGPLTSGVLRVA